MCNSAAFLHVEEIQQGEPGKMSKFENTSLSATQNSLFWRYWFQFQILKRSFTCMKEGSPYLVR